MYLLLRIILFCLACVLMLQPASSIVLVKAVLILKLLLMMMMSQKLQTALWKQKRTSKPDQLQLDIPRSSLSSFVYFSRTSRIFAYYLGDLRCFIAFIIIEGLKIDLALSRTLLDCVANGWIWKKSNVLMNEINVQT